MTKRTYASVTEVTCTCDYLENAANDPKCPIIFDEATSEYQFTDNRVTLVIYHCPFCGGAAPESKRALLFAQIPENEERRLAGLLNGIETMDGALSKLGQPDFEGVSTTRKPEGKNDAPRIQHHREIRYHQLSDVAEVWITERTDGKVFWQLQGKHIGERTTRRSRTEPLKTKWEWWRFWER